ncbi:MAG: deiodinase-like protein [Tepidisphaeraceae bacterium]
MFLAPRSWPLPIVICAALIGLLAAAAPADDTFRPTADRAVGLAARRPYAILDRFKQAVSHLTLTDDQKPKVDQIFQNASQQADELARRTEDPSLAERYQALGAFARQLHQELAQVLSVGQMETLQLYLGPGSASRPTADDFTGGGGRLWANLPKAFAKLDLSPDERQQIRDLMQSVRQKAQEIRGQTANGGDVQSQMQQLRQDMRGKLQSILTPDQMQTLVQTLQQMRQEQAGATTQPQKPFSRDPKGSAFSAEDSEEFDHPAPAAAQTSPEVGSPAPDVKILELNGRAFIPANYKGHVLVLEFGSLSCPVFRDHVQEMEKLKSAEGPRAFFLFVYTREAFPAGDKDVQRNNEQDISVPKAKTLDERKMQAQQTQQTLQITMPMAVDSMDDAVTSAFGTFPNGAVVIGKDGNIAALEHWTNPESLRRAIDEAYDAPAASNR